MLPPLSASEIQSWMFLFRVLLEQLWFSSSAVWVLLYNSVVDVELLKDVSSSLTSFRWTGGDFESFKPMPPSCSTLAQLNSSLIKLSVLSARSGRLLRCRALTLSTDTSSQETRRSGRGAEKEEEEGKRAQCELSTSCCCPRTTECCCQFWVLFARWCWSKRSRRSLKRQRLMHNNKSFQWHTPFGRTHISPVRNAKKHSD